MKLRSAPIFRASVRLTQSIHPLPPMKSYLPLLALALALPLAACGGDEAAEAPDVDVVAVDPVVEDDPMVDDVPAVTAQGTLDAVQEAGGLTSLAPGAAVANIDGWIAQLEGNADAAPVVENLEMLKAQLTTDPLDGAAIGTTLMALGEQTTAAAGGDTALEQLGGALTSAGEMLTGDSM